MLPLETTFFLITAIIFSGFIFVLGIIKWLTSRKSNSIGCLVGKTAIVTGGNSGLGLGICYLLASRGCRIIIANRSNSEKNIKEIIRKTGNPNISYKFLDLSSLASVREFVEEIGKTERKIDILINNAGVGKIKDVKTKDGLNAIMQINYFGSFLLTHLLMKLLKESSDARVVFTSSLSVHFHDFKLEKLNFTEYNSEEFFNSLSSYENSKLCNILAAQEFAKKSKHPNIKFYSVDPGIINTPIHEKSSLPILVSLFFKILILFSGQEPLISAQTAFDVVSNEKFQYQSGGYYFGLISWFKPGILKNKEICEKVWKASEELVQLKEEEKLNYDFFVEN